MKGTTMSGEQATILVAGATGTQGGSVVRHLRAGGFAVRGITRDPDAEKAQPLRAAGVELVRADLTDRASVDGLFDGVTGVFSVATPFEAGLEAEVAQGKTLGDAAKTRQGPGGRDVNDAAGRASTCGDQAESRSSGCVSVSRASTSSRSSLAAVLTAVCAGRGEPCFGLGIAARRRAPTSPSALARDARGLASDNLTPTSQSSD
jgi:hypothetical protein